MFTAVVGYIDKGRLELHQRVQVIVQRTDVLTLQRRQYFKGNKCFFGLVDVINDFHEQLNLWIEGQKYNLIPMKFDTFA
jgi:hypothetical protein